LLAAARCTLEGSIFVVQSSSLVHREGGQLEGRKGGRRSWETEGRRRGSWETEGRRGGRQWRWLLLLDERGEE